MKNYIKKENNGESEKGKATPLTNQIISTRDDSGRVGLGL